MYKVESNKFDKIPIYLIAFLFSLALIVFLLTVGVPHYDTNDDVTLNNIAIGNYGEQNTAYLVFSNICYGWFLSQLYGIVGSINWYAIFPVAMAIITLLMLVFILVNRSPNSVGVVLSLAVIYFFGQPILVNVQFTHLAGYFSAIGLFFMYTGLMEKTRIHKFYAWGGLVIAFLGFCLRKDTFLSVAAIIGVCCLVKIIKYKFWTIGFKQIIGYAFPFLLLFAVIGIASVINMYAYQTAPDWAYWTEYNTLRASLLDYPTPSFDLYAEKYLAIGIDELDLQLLFSWNYGDKEKFSIETMEKLCELQQEYLGEIHSNPKIVVYNFIKNVLSSFSNNIAFLFVATLSAGLAFWKKKNLWILVPVIVLGGELFYLSYCGRFIFRTYLGLWLALSFIVFYELAGTTTTYNSRNVPKVLASSLAFFVFIVPWLYNVIVTGEQTQERISEYTENYNWRQVLSKDDDTLYVHETLFGGIPDSLLAFETPQQYDHNIYCLGGWTNPSPLQEYLLEKHGVHETGVIQGLLDNDKSVYYIELDDRNYRQRFLAYLKKEYDSNIQMEPVNRIDNLNVYRFFIDENYNEVDPAVVENSYNLDNAVAVDDIQCSFTLFQTETEAILRGWCYLPSVDSYKQNMWLRITDGQEQLYIRGLKEVYVELAEIFDDFHAPASGIAFYLDPAILATLVDPSFEIIVEANGQLVASDISTIIQYN